METMKYFTKDIVLLRKTEQEVTHLCDIFGFKDTSSWVTVKSEITNIITHFNDNTQKNVAKNQLYKFIYLSILSLGNYLKTVFDRKNKTLFVGAGSGLFTDQGKVLDSYFPYKEEKIENVLYWLSADIPNKLYAYKEYLKDNNIVIYSFIFSPFKILLLKLLFIFRKKKARNFQKISNFLDKHNVNNYTLLKSHLKFVSGYLLYSVVLKLLKVNKLYVVSAYSNSDIVAVAKKRGIPVIEMQHGIIGVLHRGYNYALKDNKLPTPDMVYVYNEYWEEELLKAGFYTKDEIKVYGRLKYELLDSNATLESKSKFIVFTGQNCYLDKIVEFFKQSHQILLENDIKLYYLPHPNEIKSDLDETEKSLENYKNIKIIKEREFTTENYIYHCVAHISLYSSCHFDAIHYKGLTFILDVMEDNIMDYYTESNPNKFIKIRKIEELLKVLK